MAFELSSQDYIVSMVRAESNVLQQFRTKPVFMALLGALCSEVQVLQDVLIDIQNKRGPLVAVGVQLEALGRIVGQGRDVISVADSQWFTPDDSAGPADNFQAPLWTQGAPGGLPGYADDNWLRRLIEAKVKKNFVRSSSVPELQDVIKQAFGVDCGFVRDDAFQGRIVLPVGAPSYVKDYVTRYFSIDVVEDTIGVGYPATADVTGIIEV
jgi:hypothetical protein